MKLNRLESTTQGPPTEGVARQRREPGERVRRVETLERIEGDRERSLQQELAEFDPRATGPFEGGERVQQDAHELAERLRSLGEGADGLLDRTRLRRVLHGVDEAA